MAWSKTYDTGDDLGISDTDSGHYAVIITAVDGASDNNPGYTDGWTWGGDSRWRYQQDGAEGSCRR